jgi:hypothetical protein
MENYSSLHSAILHLPIVTTLVSAVFAFQLFSRYRRKGGGLHLLWWGLGMITYGIGTFTEAYTTVIGWNPVVFRIWYIAGAFLGGYPLAQGSIYLLTKRRFAHASAWIICSAVVIGGVLMFLTPLDTSLAEPHRLDGEVIVWSKIRLMTPAINLYSLIFLAGGAAVSAVRMRKKNALRNRYLGNIWISLGAILPGIGGTMTRFGIVEALYLTELIGLLMIFIGYRLAISQRMPASGVKQATASASAN